MLDAIAIRLNSQNYSSCAQHDPYNNNHPIEKVNCNYSTKPVPPYCEQHLLCVSNMCPSLFFALTTPPFVTIAPQCWHAVYYTWLLYYAYKFKKLISLISRHKQSSMCFNMTPPPPPPTAQNDKKNIFIIFFVKTSTYNHPYVPSFVYEFVAFVNGVVIAWRVRCGARWMKVVICTHKISFPSSIWSPPEP